MNALKMASEKRKVKASLDKARWENPLYLLTTFPSMKRFVVRPKLDALDADNTLLREELAADAKQM